MVDKITIDEKEYVPKTEYDKLLNRTPQVEVNILKDIYQIKGVGSVNLTKGGYVSAKFSLDEINKILKSLAILNIDNENVVFTWSNDAPIIIGAINKKDNIASGIILAPRVD